MTLSLRAGMQKEPGRGDRAAGGNPIRPQRHRFSPRHLPRARATCWKSFPPDMSTSAPCVWNFSATRSTASARSTRSAGEISEHSGTRRWSIPATHYAIATRDNSTAHIDVIEHDLAERCAIPGFQEQGAWSRRSAWSSARSYDIEMLREIGLLHGHRKLFPLF